MKPFNKKLVFIAKLFEPVWFFYSFFLEHKRISQVRKILILDFHHIGDIVLLMPLLECLRSSHPNAKITLVAGPWARDILKTANTVDEIIEFLAPWVKSRGLFKNLGSCYKLICKLRKQRWDIGIDVRGDIRHILLMCMSGVSYRVGFDMMGGRSLLNCCVDYKKKCVHLSDYHKSICEALGIWDNDLEYTPKLLLRASEKDSVKDVPSYVGIHFGASSALRRIEIKKAKNLLEQILNQFPKNRVVIFHLPEDVLYFADLFEHAKKISINQVESWSGTLREFIVFLSRCDILFCLDSGPAHIAAALGIQTKVIYGPSDFRITRPIGKSVEVLEGNNPFCWPCSQKVCHSKDLHGCYKNQVNWNK
jgi:ADP-heptose:LPS heptosyltransferase